MDEQLRKAAHEYHRLPTPGKIAVTATKGLSNQRDLALAYTPGVASVCETIAADPAVASIATVAGTGMNQRAPSRTASRTTSM